MPVDSRKAGESIPPFRSIYIRLTDECNQHCPYCWASPVLEGRSTVKRPDLAQYRRFIDRAVPLGLSRVKVTGGEPLLRVETLLVLAHASRRGVATAIDTNAALVGEVEVDFFRRNRVHVGTSLDVCGPDGSDPRRGLRGALQRTWKAVKAMTRAGIDLTVTAAVSHGSLGEIDRILDRLAGIEGRRGRIAVKINPIVTLRRVSSMNKRREALFPHELLEFTNRVLRDLAPSYREKSLDIILQLESAFFPIGSMVQAVAASGARHCGFLNLISVLADGSITLCGIGPEQKHLIMGNIQRSYDLTRIWERALDAECQAARFPRPLRRLRKCLAQSDCLSGCRAAAVAAGASAAESPLWCQSLYDAGLFPASRLNDESAKRYAEIAPSLQARFRQEAAALA